MAVIKKQGLDPRMVSIIAGAAGGPKWIILAGLDRAIFFSWLKKTRKEPLFLVGSSIGAWRFAACTHNNALKAIERFQYAYIHQRYDRVPTPEELTAECARILNEYIEDPDDSGILHHSYYRLSILADRSRGLLSTDESLSLGTGLALTALGNTVTRRSLGLFLERTLFYDPRDIPPFFGMDRFPIHRVPLTGANLKSALMASGSIPLVMAGIDGIPGAPRGMYRDGGLIDYHLDIPYSAGDGKIVLYPHYTDRMIPGWFDKALKWRKPVPDHIASVLLVSPSSEYISTLPNKKIPDRSDFKRFKFRDDERIACWNTVLRESERLGEEFLETVTTGRIADMIRPL